MDVFTAAKESAKGKNFLFCFNKPLLDKEERMVMADKLGVREEELDVVCEAYFSQKEFDLLKEAGVNEEKINKELDHLNNNDPKPKKPWSFKELVGFLAGCRRMRLESQKEKEAGS